jgi:hypothetical protein
MEHNMTCVTLQETLYEIKLIRKEIETSQIKSTISSTHRDTNTYIVYKHNDQNK